MAVRPKPGGRLSEFLADLRLQRRRQQEKGEMAIYKFRTITLKGQASELAGDSVGGTKLEKVMDVTIISTVKHLKARFSSLLGESASGSDTAKAVKCFNIFNHDSWPENQENLVDHGADDLAFLLDHFSTVLRRNGVNTDLAKEEFVGLKLLIARIFKDKTYLSLWELMLTREPYCSQYKDGSASGQKVAPIPDEPPRICNGSQHVQYEKIRIPVYYSDQYALVNSSEHIIVTCGNPDPAKSPWKQSTPRWHYSGHWSRGQLTRCRTPEEQVEKQGLNSLLLHSFGALPGLRQGCGETGPPG
ncbi:uncharacterized protein LOC115545037 [Gadus morhua]|uniref:uncharacterized protein LOC115545037 n=1 Tax=Gadus morhua TaxID=8049 RepID=UPI0011B4F94C|nr:uncharacterized protein LOC115545037 [Gadus morhua]